MRSPSESQPESSRLILPNVPAYLISAESAIDAGTGRLGTPDTSLEHDELLALGVGQIRATEAIARALLDTNVQLSRISAALTRLADHIDPVDRREPVSRDGAAL